MWLLLVVATLLLISAAQFFDDGALRPPVSSGRLILGVMALTAGGVVATLAVFESWHPPHGPRTEGQPAPLPIRRWHSSINGFGLNPRKHR